MISCADVRYLAECTKGHLSLLSGRKSIHRLLEDPAVSPEMKEKFRTVLDIRNFASSNLRLPDNGSYRCYVDLERPNVVWNVVAAPEFNLRPLQWCFPVAGCVTYRGFFDEEKAKKFAEDLRRKGNDVYLYGVSAYSTLGWFDDPILNTFFGRTDTDLAGLIFHELSHQKLYVKNDSFFNEAFAKTVEVEGVLRWLRSSGMTDQIPSYMEKKKRGEDFLDLVKGYQKELASLYRSPLDREVKRAEKELIFRDLREAYAHWKKGWSDYSGYDRWFSQDLNNAKLASINTYHTYVPAFRALLKSSGGDFENFYEMAEKIGGLPPEKRLARMEELRNSFVAETSEYTEAGMLMSDLSAPETEPRL